MGEAGCSFSGFAGNRLSPPAGQFGRKIVESKNLI
jgi:hypothetical protein